MSTEASVGDQSLEGHQSVHVSLRRPLQGYHEVMADRVVKYAPDTGDVLEIGCGSGHILAQIRRKNPELRLTACDIDPDCLAAARQRVPDLDIFTIDPEGTALDAVEQRFDAVLMCHSLEHMPNPILGIQRAMRLLRPGGHLVLAVPNPVRPNVFFSALGKKHYVNHGHIYAWDRSHWMNFLERIQELEVVEYPNDEARLFNPKIARRIRPLKSIEWGLAKVAPWWSFSNMAVIRKPA